MKGDSEKELATAVKGINRLGGAYVKTENLTLPDGARRDIIIIKKSEPTPKRYPRNGGKIQKSPL